MRAMHREIFCSGPTGRLTSVAVFHLPSNQAVLSDVAAVFVSRLWRQGVRCCRSIGGRDRKHNDIKNMFCSLLGELRIRPPMVEYICDVMVIAVLSIVACTKQESNQVSGTTPVGASATDAVMPSQRSTGSLQVKMLPERRPL